MANHYLQFSEVIPNLTKPEAKWAEARLKEMTDKWDEDPDEGWYFKWEIHEEHKGDEEKNGTHIWFFAEESGEPEHVVAFAKEFLRKFRPDSYFSISWASFCDKLRPGEFDGGACFVTAEREEWLVAYDFIQSKTKAFETQMKKASSL